MTILLPLASLLSYKRWFACSLIATTQAYPQSPKLSFHCPPLLMYMSHFQHEHTYKADTHTRANTHSFLHAPFAKQYIQTSSCSYLP